MAGHGRGNYQSKLKMNHLIAATEADMVTAAQHLAKAVLEARIVTLEGNLGAGKTTLVRNFCALFGVTDPVSSPTFSIINTYASAQGPIHHMDLYRLKNVAEAVDVGLEDYLHSEEICLIEWPEVASTILPRPYLRIALQVEGMGRKLTFETVA